MARPRKSSTGDLLSEVVTFNTTRAELDRIERLATDRGESRSEWLRRAAAATDRPSFADKPRPEFERA